MACDHSICPNLCWVVLSWAGLPGGEEKCRLQLKCFFLGHRSVKTLQVQPLYLDQFCPVPGTDQHLGTSQCRGAVTEQQQLAEDSIPPPCAGTASLVPRVETAGEPPGWRALAEPDPRGSGSAPLPSRAS